jgi:hypothetical protein
MSITATERTQIVELTVLMFNAAPGATYLSQLVSLYEADGHNLQTLAVQLAGTTAYQTLNPNFQLAADFATAFLTPLGLQADAVAVAFVTSKFNAGESKGLIAYEAFNALNAVTSANGVQYQNAKAILLNKTAVAEYYSEVKAVAETNLGALQNVLSTITADPATVTAEIAALNVVPPLLLNLTTGVDVVHAEVGNNSIVTGTADAAGTFTVGDVITGNATTVFNLALNGTPTSLSTVTNVGTVNLNADASTTVNADLWSGIGSINVVTPTIAGTTTTISNAQVATTIGDYSGNQASITVTYRDTSGTADTAHVALGGTGTSTAASTIDVSSGNTVEGLALVTAGTNYATVNGGTADKAITITGTGANTLTFGATAATLTVDASATTASQKLTFVAGSIGAEDTILGGTGADTVTANSALKFAHMTGVETFVTTVDGGVGLFDGANVSGLTTMTINQGTSAGSEIFTNMKAEFATLNINGPTGSQEVDYVAGADATLAVTYGPGSSAYDSSFDGLSVDNVKDLTVTFNVGGVAADPITVAGDITLDKTVTTSLTVTDAGSLDAFTTTMDVKRADSLDSLVIRATGEATWLNISADIATNQNTQGLQHLEVTASGASSFAGLYAWDYNGASSLSTALTSSGNVMSLDTLAITASGASSSAYVDTYIFSVGNMSSAAITASGDNSTAWASYTMSVSGDIGAISGVASGQSASAYYDEGIYVYGNVGSVTFTASAADANAYLYSYLSVSADLGSITLTASGDSSSAYIYDAVFVGGNLDTVTITASGDTSEAYIDSYLTVSGDIGDITLTASGASSTAYIYYLYGYGDLNSLTLTASGADSYAWMETTYVAGDLGSLTLTASGNTSSVGISLSTVSGDVGSIALVASGHDSDAHMWTYTDIVGNLGSLTVTASGSGSSAGDYGSYYYTAEGNVGTVTVTASGKTAYADAYMYVSGNMSALNVTASGATSTADAYIYQNDGSMTLGSLTETASGVNATAYADVQTGSGVLATATISATKLGADATLNFVGNTFGSIATSTGTATSAVTLTLDNTTSAGGTITGTGPGTLTVTVVEKSIASLSASGETGVVTFNVSDVTKATTAMSITTGSGADVVWGGKGADTFAVGAGADTIHFDNVDGVLPSGGTLTAVTDTIASGFTSGSDVLDFTTAGSGTNYTENLTAAASLTALVTAADTALNGTIQYYFGVVGTDGYLVYDADGTGQTVLLKLTGVTDMAYTDIV